MERRRTRETRQAREAREATEARMVREATEARMEREEWKLIEKKVEKLFKFFVVSLFLMWWFFAPVRDRPIREEVVDEKPKHHIVNVGLDIPIKEYPIELLRTDELIICSIPLELSWQYLWSSASVHVKSALSCATIEKDANITDLTSNQKSSFLEMFNPFAWIMKAVRKPEVMQDYCDYEFNVPFVRPFCSIFKFDVPSHLLYIDEVVSINYVFNQFDPILIAYSICGVLLWFLAGFLSKNQYFQFFCQVATIVFFSIVIAIFFIVNSFDKKNKIGAMAILTCSAPLIYKFWIPAIWNIIITFKSLTAIYLLTTTSASMVYFYVQGPIENPRIHNLIKVGIKLVAIRFLFMGMTTRMIPLSVIFAFIISPTLFELDKSYNLTSSFELKVISNITKIKKRIFPEPRKLLSLEEYELQLDEFTYKSLIDLKNYCLSPDCNLREILSRLSKPEKMVHFFTDSQSLLDLDAKEVNEYKEYIISNDLHIPED